jgi:AcrR family transcriptional regulator
MHATFLYAAGMNTGQAPAQTAPRRRTQQERSDTTRAALLDAAIECLAEYGYARATTAVICERAGVSRGAHLHHYGTRAALLAAAITHLSQRIDAQLHNRIAALPDGPDRTERALDLIWELFSGPLFRSALELWTIGRTDPDLMRELAPAEHNLNRVTVRVWHELFPDQAGTPDFDHLTDFVLSSVRGLALLDIVQPSGRSSKSRWPYARARLLDTLNRTPRK